MANADLIQANINRATKVPVKSSTAGTTEKAAEAKGKKVDTPETENIPASDHKSILGANFDILKTLDSIKFVGNNDGAMYNSIAYIELWKRTPSGDTKDEAGTEVEGAPPEYFEDLGYFEGDVDEYELLYGPDTSEVTPGNTTAAAGDKKEAIGTVVPTTTAPSDQPSGTATSAKVKPAPTKGAQKKVSGPVKSANPGGGGGGTFREALNRKPGYKGGLSSTSNGTGNIPEGYCSAKGVWQFLFNPEEIDWEGGPEYSESETWGVMGEANAGKPLSWKNMKNQRLTFSKVLLNGYVFGKRVDILEKGLKSLFMREDGDNSDGPPVLNLIWGKRTFGPCVLKDLRIKEKNWDNGILVNAEVSFTLEKIPEWIVNDGYVDVARPGKQPILGDVFVGPSDPNANRDTPADDKGGEDNKPGSSADAAACKEYKKIVDSAITLYKKIDPQEIERLAGPIPTGAVVFYRVSFNKIRDAYKKYVEFMYLYAGLYNKLYSNPTYQRSMSNLPNKCTAVQVKASKKFLDGIFNQVVNDVDERNNSALLSFIDKIKFPAQVLQDCSEQIVKDVTSKVYNANNCSRFNTQAAPKTNKPKDGKLF